MRQRISKKSDINIRIYDIVHKIHNDKKTAQTRFKMIMLNFEYKEKSNYKK